MAIKHETPAMRLANQLRENPAEFIQQTVHPEGVFHTTGFKEYLETRLPFIIFLEEADIPHVQIHYWTPKEDGLVMHVMKMSAFVPLGEHEPRWVANAVYENAHRFKKPTHLPDEAFAWNTAMEVWNRVAVRYNEQPWGATRQEIWIFPFGLTGLGDGKRHVLHAKNYK